jgi:hypothetical protein
MKLNRRTLFVLACALAPAFAQGTPSLQIAMNPVVGSAESTWTWSSQSPAWNAPQNFAAVRCTAEPGSWVLLLAKVWIDPAVAGNRQAADALLIRYSSMQRSNVAGTSYSALWPDIDAASEAAVAGMPAGAIRIPVAKAVTETAETVGLSLNDPQPFGVRAYAHPVLAGATSAVWRGSSELWEANHRRNDRGSSSEDWAPLLSSAHNVTSDAVFDLQKLVDHLVREEAVANQFNESEAGNLVRGVSRVRVDLQAMVFDGLNGQSATTNPATTPGLATLAAQPTPLPPRLRFTVPLTVTVQVPTTLENPTLAIVWNPAPYPPALFGGLGESTRALISVPYDLALQLPLYAVIVGIESSAVAPATVLGEISADTTIVEFVVPPTAPSGSLYFVDAGVPWLPLGIPSHYAHAGGFLFLAVPSGLITPVGPWVPN